MIWILLTSAFAGPPALEALTYQLPRCQQLTDARETSRQLARLHAEDDRDRKRWSASIPERDAARVEIVQRFVAERRVCSPQDHFHAAVILQRSTAPADQLRAHVYAFHALASGVRKAERLTAVTYDRWLVSHGSPQWYGTQFRTDNEARTCLIEIDPRADDTDRILVGLPTVTEVVRLTQLRNGREPIAEGLVALDMNGLYCGAVAWDEEPTPARSSAPLQQ